MAFLGLGKRGGARPAEFFAGAAAWLLLASTPCFAQTQHEFWPGFDAYIQLNERTRLYLNIASLRSQDPATKATKNPEGTVGAHLDVSLKPLLRRKLAQKSDWERERYLWCRVGYEYTTTLGSTDDPSHEHLGILELTGRLPLPKQFWVAQRIRVDLRDANGEFSTRPRYRLQLERGVRIFGVETVPYVNAEVFYDTRFDAVNRQRYQARLEVVVSKHWRVEPYFTRQHDRRPQVRNVNAFGLTVKYYH
jgi:hypothetical protein